jgi:hypothetical protein
MWRLSYSSIMGLYPKYSKFTDVTKFSLSRSGINLADLKFIHSLFAELIFFTFNEKEEIFLINM